METICANPGSILSWGWDTRCKLDLLGIWKTLHHCISSYKVKEPSQVLFGVPFPPIKLLKLVHFVLWGNCLAATLSEYSGFKFKVVGVVVAVFFSFLIEHGLYFVFVKNRAGSSDWTVGRLMTDRLSVFVWCNALNRLVKDWIKYWWNRCGDWAHLVLLE